MATSQSVIPSSIHRPFVTIAIPTFNRASLLKDCIALAQSQSYSNFEILVSDNASTDETADILRQFSDPRLRVVRQQQNIGLLPNWNACLAEARGEYTVFVSDDDKIEPWLLERCMAVVEIEKVDVVIALSDTYFTTPGRREPAAVSQKLATGVWEASDILKEFLRKRISAHMCTIMMRTEALRASGGFPIDFPHAADVAGWAPLLLNGKGGLVNETCGIYLVHGASETSGLGIDVILDDFKRIISLLSRTADRLIRDQKKRREIKFEILRHFTLRTMILIMVYRDGGAALRNALPLVWKWHRELIAIHSPRLTYSVLKSLAGPYLLTGRRQVRQTPSSPENVGD